MLHVAIHDPWNPWSNGHLKLGTKMGVPPWLRKPPFNDFLIDHMSDVPLVSNISGCFSTPIMAARISPLCPILFSWGSISVFSFLFAAWNLVPGVIEVFLWTAQPFFGYCLIFKTNPFYHILPRPDMWFFHSFPLLTTFYHFPQTLVPWFPTMFPQYTHKFPSNQIRFTSGPPWKSQRRSKLKSL